MIIAQILKVFEDIYSRKVLKISIQIYSNLKKFPEIF